MRPENRIPTHPGEILQEQFLDPLELTQVALAEHLGVPVQRINEIVCGKCGLTPATRGCSLKVGPSVNSQTVDLTGNFRVMFVETGKLRPRCVT